MTTPCFTNPNPEGSTTSEPGDLAFNLVQILQSARFDLESDREKAKESIARVSSLLGLDLLPSTGSAKPYSSGGLARWQVLRLQTYIESRIDRNVSVLELSQFLRLSASHFARTFKKTFQETPHTYILRRRVSHAKHLLVSSSIPLHEIALCCGFADQAHLCRVFKKFARETPATWRRYRLQVIARTYESFAESAA